ncbi:MAG: D-alanine--D-alanine ligase [Pseudonocardiales bacterium]|nr:D-alanine--D-alanine ligase [Pseudonocardiales bacterium]
MGRIRVAVVFGGRSSEHGISVVSAGSVLGALDRLKYDVVTVGITAEGRWVQVDPDAARLAISDRQLPAITSGPGVALPGDPTAGGLIALAPPGDGSGSSALASVGAVDVVFPVLHGPFGEDGTIQGLLEMAGVPYVGSGVFASAAGMDKEFTKKLLRAEGLSVGEFVVLRQGDGLASLPAGALERLGLPAFVKPARAGSSMGITRVTDPGQFADALTLAFQHDSKLLIEAGVVGREIECGVLDGPDGPIASLPAEIRMRPGRDWYDFEAKYLDDACDFDVPAVLPPEVTARIQALAVAAFRALDCAGLARVDFFLRPDGEVIVNEINTMPGFTPISMYPRMWAASGVDYPTLIDTLIQSALRRAGR